MADVPLMRRLSAALAAVLSLALAPAAHADEFLPPAGKIFDGIEGGTSLDPFARETSSEPEVFGFFTKFGGANEFIFRGAEQAGSRLMLHISTQDGYGTREVVTPLGIARGEGDRYLVGLNRRIAEHGQPTYVRLMAEMNQANSGYAAFDKSGRSRGRWTNAASRCADVASRAVGCPLACIRRSSRQASSSPRSAGCCWECACSCRGTC